MNMEQVALLFGLFAGPDVVAEEYTPILTMAVQEVRQGLLPDADETDARLCYLAAAVALLNVCFGVKQLGGMSGDISGFAITRGELGGVLALAVLIWLGGIL